jgi:beta-lactamase superfamily II metal-dependent hydrolase
MENIDCDVALMPHHGSRLSWPREFIQWCRPEFAVISAGRNRTDDAMLQQLRDLNCQPLVTGGEGSIRFRFEQDRVLMSAWNGNQWQPRR